MYKAYKFRIYPNNDQKILLNKSFGCTRLIYNHYLSLAKEEGYKNPNTYIHDYVYNYKYEFPFLTEVDSTLIRKSIFHLDDAFESFFKNNKGFPKFKSRNSRNSYTTNAIYRNYKDREYCNIELDLNKRVYHCLNCNNILDRDLNASINIMFEGLKLYMKDRLSN